ncbi:hypothetical protein [Halioxenophilus aromaticivorans]
MVIEKAIEFAKNENPCVLITDQKQKAAAELKLAYRKIRKI